MSGIDIALLVGTVIIAVLIIIDIIVRILLRRPGLMENSKSNDHLLAIRKITSKVTEAESFESVINAIISITSGALHAEIGSILLYDEDKKGLVIIASEGLSDEIRKNTVIRDDESVSWWVFANKQPLLIEDVRKETRFRFHDNPLYKGNSLMCVPIRTGDSILGVCSVTNHLTGTPFDDQSLKTMTSIAGQVAVIVDNEVHHQKLFKKINELQSLYDLSEQVSHSLDLRETLNNITQLAVKITGTDACSLRLLNPDTNELDIMSCTGVTGGYKQKGALKIGQGVGGYVAQEGIPVMIPDLRHDKRIHYTSYLQAEGLLSLVSVPIKAEDESVIGIISVYKRQAGIFQDDTVNLLSTFANNTSIAIKNARLFETIKDNYYETIQSLALALEARDKYTRGHSERVTDFAVQIAQEMNLSESDIDILRFAGKLHDIGKIAISDNILLKEDRLTLSEYADIKTHPIKGAELLEPLRFLEQTIPMIKHHHERFDGKGYPEGLIGERIPIMARIISVADAFDAMTSARPYRAPKSQDHALGEIARHAGSQFDPEVVEAFQQVIAKMG